MHTHPINNTSTPSSKIIAFRPDEAQAFGLEDAIVLSQIRYWTDPKRCNNLKDNRLWVYNSVREWQVHFVTMSISMIRRVLNRLEDLEVIITKKYNAWRRDQRKWYTINVDRLKEVMKTLCPPQSSTHTSRHRKSPPDIVVSPALKEPVLDPLEKAVFDSKEASLTSSISTKKDAEKSKNGGNVDLLTVSKCTFAHQGQMSSKSTQQITSLSLPSQIDSSSSLKSAPEQQTSTLREMIKIWNQNIEDKPDLIKPTPWRHRTLLKAFKAHFDTSIDQWTHYCQTIAHNSFLMGGGTNKWKASIDWAIKEQNIHKVLEKRYTGQRDIPRQTAPIVINPGDIKGSDTWKQMAALLLKELGPWTFKTWLLDCSLKNETSTHPQLCFKSDFFRDYSQQHFRQTMDAIAKKVMPHMRCLDYKTDKHSTLENKA